MKRFKKGSKVYIHNGEVGKYISPDTTPRLHIVGVYLLCGDCEEYDEGSTFLIRVHEDHIHKTPPTKLHDKNIALAKQEYDKRNEQCRRLSLEINKKKAEIFDIEVKYKDAMFRYGRVEGLEILEAFLEDKITHYVVYQYGSAKIKTSEETLKYEDNSWGRDKLKLLTLFGDTKGNLSWNLHEYPSAGHSTTIVYPCVGLDQAHQAVITIYTQLCDKAFEEIHERGTCNASYLMAIAKEHNLRIPVEVQTIHDSDRLESLNKSLDKQAGEIKDTESKIAAIESRAKDPS